MRLSISAKLIILFVSILFMSGFCSSAGFTIVNERKIIEELESQMDAFSLQVQVLYKIDGIPMENLMNLLNNSYYKVKIFNSIEEIGKEDEVNRYFYEDEILSLNENSQIRTHGHKNNSLKSKFPAIISKMAYDGRYVYFFICPDLNLGIFNFRGLITQFILIFFGASFLLILFMSRKMVKPVKDLAKATHKIAGGDFNVRVESKSKDEIGELINDFNKMAKELQGIEIMRNNFISDISHEFRTPLTSIEGYVKLLRDCGNEDEKNSYIDIITSETARLSALSRGILLINRLDNETNAIIKENFRLDEQIRQIILLLESAWSNKNIDMDLSMEKVFYEGNADLLFQVWLNLIENAIKFSPENGKITINLDSKKEKIFFSIEDEGPGVPENSHGKIFDKFYKADASRSSSGNGLGLSIVKRIVDIHGGTVKLSSEKNGGAKFEISL